VKILIQHQHSATDRHAGELFYNTAKILQKKGLEILAAHTGKERPDHDRQSEIKSVYLPCIDAEKNFLFQHSRQDIKKNLLSLESLVLQEKPDIIHLNNTDNPYIYDFFKKHCPIILTVNDFSNLNRSLLKLLPEYMEVFSSEINCRKERCIPSSKTWKHNPLWTRRSNLKAIKNFDMILTPTPHMKYILKTNGINKDRIEVVTDYMDDSGATETNEDHVLIYSGELVEENGVFHFIRMLKNLKRRFRAAIIGDGPIKTACEDLIIKLNLTNRVHFTGPLNKAERKVFFAQAAVVVIPTLWPAPRCDAGLEAIMSAKPIVTYDSAGIPHLLRDNHNGFMARRGDVEGLALRIDTLVKNRTLIENMGKNGRKIFEEKFTPEQHAQSLLNAYESAIALRKRGYRAKIKKEHPEINNIEHPERLPDEPLPVFNRRLIDFEISNGITEVKSYPEEITISTTTRCNMEPPCVMCERNGRTKDEEYDLDPSALEKIEHIFKHADRIYLHCGGEPLMTPMSFRIIESVQPPTRIIFNTNGALFTEKIIRRVVDSHVVDVISFSLDAATEETYKKIRSANFNRVISNIKALIAYRNEKHRKNPLVLMNFCIFKRNVFEIPDYVKLAHSLGADGLDFSHLNQGFDWQQKREDYTFDYKYESVLNMENPEKHDELVLKAYELGKSLNIPINFNGSPFLSVNNEFKAKARDELAEVIKNNRKCYAPWSRLVMDTDGRMRMCYFHNSEHETIGKIASNSGKPYYIEGKSFSEVWNSREAVSVREEFLKNGIARRCITKNPCIFQNRL